MRSLPAERLSSDLVVSSPYATAQAAHTRATTIPWFIKKLVKERSSAVYFHVPRENRAH
jgi:hypothetical protein